jgi:Hint domain
MTITIAASFSSSYFLVGDSIATVTGRIVASVSPPAALYAYGNGTNSWSITNSGTIIGTGINGVQLGVALSAVSTGVVANQTGGSISGSNYGVLINNLGNPGTDIVNYGSATIYGGSHGVGLAGYGTVNNSGTITAGPTSSGADVLLSAGGVVNNNLGGTIQGYTGVYLANGGGGIVTNAGQIIAQSASIGSVGVLITGGGALSNTSTGSIQGYQGVVIGGGAGTVSNAGLITASGIGGIYAVVFGQGGSVDNTGTIQGHSGVSLNAAGTVTNEASINASAGYGIRLGGGGVAGNTGTIQGGIYVAGGIASTVTNAGSINGLTNDAVFFATGNASSKLIVDPGATFTGAINGGAGTMELTSGSPGSLGGLGVSIANFGTLQFDSSAAWSVSGTYLGLSPMQISGFENGNFNTIELTGFAAVSETYATNALTLGDGISDFETLAIVGVSGSPSGFQITNDGSNTFIVDCFASGTHIATPGGAARVEDLAIGDLVNAHFAGAVAIEWIGHRHLDCTRHPDPRKVWPVRVAAGTFGPLRPTRDLTLSPNHAVYVNGELIPIGRLINGTSIVQIPVDRITYYHVELAEHDLLLAEGVLAESYLDVGDRSNFGNAGGEVRLFPDFANCSPDVAATWETRGCAPLLLCGPGLEKARDWISALAAEACLAAAA